MEPAFPNPIGTLILLGILMFIVFRVLSSLSRQDEQSTGPKSSKGKILPFRNRQAPPNPPTIELISHTGPEDPFADKSDAMEAHKMLIEKGGLSRIGDFKIKEIPGFIIRSFTHPDQFLLGVLFRGPEDRVWVNLVTEYKDGRVITTSSAERGMISPSRPWGMPLFNFPDLSTDQLLRRHKLEVRGNEQSPALPPEKFPEYFAANYAKLRAHIDEKQTSLKEVSGGDRSYAPVPVGLPASDEQSDAATEDDQSGENELAPSRAQLTEWLNLIYAKMNIPPKDRSRFRRGLVWIAEQASGESVIETITDYADVTIESTPTGQLVIRTSQGAEDIIEPDDLKGTALFDKINSCLPEGSRFTRLPVDSKGVAFYSRAT